MEAGYPPLHERVVDLRDVRDERHVCRRDFDIRRDSPTCSCTPGSRSTCS
jgi:hypothetical protein